MHRTELAPDQLYSAGSAPTPGLLLGDLLFTSGIVGLDAEGNLVGPGDAAAQTDQILTNLVHLLDEAGMRLTDVVRTTVYLADLGDHAAMDRVFRARFGSRLPCRTTVGVQLARPQYLVEIEAIAVRTSS